MSASHLAKSPRGTHTSGSAFDYSRCSAALCFDFDHSFVDGNTDLVVPSVVAPHLTDYIRARAAAHAPWTQLMADVARQMHAGGVMPTDIRSALDTIDVDPDMIRCVNEVKSCGGFTAIVSDANEFYIDSILQRIGVNVDAIVTNGGRIDGRGVLQITPYHVGAPHGCKRCPPNLCKGAVLDALQLSDGSSVDRSAATVVYVGDGDGDLCACLRLGANDVICARSGFALLRSLARKDVAPLVRARVVAWKKGSDVLREVRAALARA